MKKFTVKGLEFTDANIVNPDRFYDPYTDDKLLVMHKDGKLICVVIGSDLYEACQEIVDETELFDQFKENMLDPFSEVTEDHYLIDGAQYNLSGVKYEVVDLPSLSIVGLLWLAKREEEWNNNHYIDYTHATMPGGFDSRGPDPYVMRFYKRTGEWKPVHLKRDTNPIGTAHTKLDAGSYARNVLSGIWVNFEGEAPKEEKPRHGM